MVTFDEKKQEEKLKELHQREEEELTRVLSVKYGIPYIDLSTVSIGTDALGLIPEEKAREALLAVFKRTGKKVYIAVRSPNKEKVQFIIRELEEKGFTIVLYMASTASLERAWARYKEYFEFDSEKAGVIDVSNEKIESLAERINNIDTLTTLVQEIINSKEKRNISRIFEVMLAGAISTMSSDIHIEPEEENIRIRFRLDGVLQDLVVLNEKIHQLLLSRVKLVSGMKLNIRDQAQDGRFSIMYKGLDISVRTSVIPGAYGESVVMRILDPRTLDIPFEKLGFHPRLMVAIENYLKKPNGLILTTGPTGSGKTTTLYTFLREVYTPKIKIITIENPIEYHMDGIVQTQVDVKRNYTFFEGLRSSLRQDPDVLLVGEIRDPDTAKTAINAALTGHLVFSTLHTNDAAGAIPRLIELGVNPKVISSAVNIVMAQRLARKLCEYCKEEKVQDDKEREIIDRILQTIKIPEEERENHGKIWHSKGCPKCNNTGYKGRLSIAEGIQMSKSIEDVILANPSDREIWAATAGQQILTMPQDGIQKVLDGVTSLSELQRVVNLFEGL